MFATVVLLLLSGLTCRDKGTEPVPSGDVHLTAEDIGVTDAFIRLHATLSHGPWTITIRRDTTEIFRTPEMNLVSLDTLILDEQLLPKHSYTYRAFYLIGSVAVDSSEPLPVTTMDTTSHDFTWEIDTLGDGNSSVLHDVAIISDTLVYAVGEIYKRDSSGRFETEPYNLAIWDGKVWKLRRAAVSYLGQMVVAPLEGIFAFSPTDIWLVGSYPIHGDGTRWTLYRLPDLGINASVSRAWGTSSSNMYFVGRAGAIVRYDGHVWQKQTSGTTEYSLSNILGTSDYQIFAVGVIESQARGIVLKRSEKNWETMINGCVEGSGFDSNKLFHSQLYGTTEGVWIDTRGTIYTVGNLMYRYRSGHWDYVRSLPDNYVGEQTLLRGYCFDVDGNAPNDMIIVGQRNTVRHFNGATWTQIGLTYDFSSPIQWLSVSVRRSLTVVVGTNGQRALVEIIRESLWHEPDGIGTIREQTVMH